MHRFGANCHLLSCSLLPFAGTPFMKTWAPRRANLLNSTFMTVDWVMGYDICVTRVVSNGYLTHLTPHCIDNVLFRQV